MAADCASAPATAPGACGRTRDGWRSAGSTSCTPTSPTTTGSPGSAVPPVRSWCGPSMRPARWTRGSPRRRLHGSTRRWVSAAQAVARAPAAVGPAFVPGGSSAPAGLLGLATGGGHGLHLPAQPSARARTGGVRRDAPADAHRHPGAGGRWRAPPGAQRHRRGLGIAGAVFPGYQQQDGPCAGCRPRRAVGAGNDWRGGGPGTGVGARVVAGEEGALPDWADDTLTSEEPGALAAVALRLERQQRVLPSPTDVARDIVALYREAGARG